MPPAARLTDLHACPMVTPVVGPGVPTVLIGGRPAARLGDATAHGGSVVLGCHTVMIGG